MSTGPTSRQNAKASTLKFDTSKEQAEKAIAAAQAALAKLNEGLGVALKINQDNDTAGVWLQYVNSLKNTQKKVQTGLEPAQASEAPSW